MKTLFVLLGPTGVGKTDLSFSIAGLLHSPIISADSRQIYRDIPIGTAAPTIEQLEKIPHYFIATHKLNEEYSAAQYEQDVMLLLDKLFVSHDCLLLTGGSMLYIDGVCNGIDELPTVDTETRQYFMQRLADEGLPVLVEELIRLDPEWAARTDLKNPRRVVHALEICHIAGRPYSSLVGRGKGKRPFQIVKIGLQRPREELYGRINRRVDEMLHAGLVEEVQSVLPFRSCNALNTVGYKELFPFFDGQCTLEEAVEKIKRNTRVYSRKQMTWFNHDASVVWFHPDCREQILHFVTDMVQ